MKAFTLLAAIMLAGAADNKLAAPKPAPEAQQLRFFEGDWHCTGKQGDVKIQTHVVYRAEVNHFWDSVRVMESKSKSHPLPHESIGFCGFDVTAKQFLRMLVGNTGDWESATSPGWTGEDWVWTGEINQPDGRKVPLRHTITTNGPREYSDKVEINTGGEWRVVSSHSLCKK